MEKITATDLLSRYAAKERNFTDAVLTGANLTGADLTDADLTGAVLTDAWLTGAVLTGADLTGAIGLPDAPVVPDMEKRIAVACAVPGALRMLDWHTCGSTHCRAGWAIHHAGEEGAALENLVGPGVAGALIYWKNAGHIPDFYTTDDEAAADIAKRGAL